MLAEYIEPLKGVLATLREAQYISTADFELKSLVLQAKHDLEATIKSMGEEVDLDERIKEMAARPPQSSEED